MAKKRQVYAVRKKGTKHRWVCIGWLSTGDPWGGWSEQAKLFSPYAASVRAERFGGVVVEVPEPD